MNQAMEDFFVKRTQAHIALVAENLLLMEGYLNLAFEAVHARALTHDASKFTAPERISYIWMSWWYYCRDHAIPFQYPDGVEELVMQGWQHHLRHNTHHPEAHSHPDAMHDLDIVEMVCDWTAISQEQGAWDSSCLSWATENLPKKWDFSKNKRDLIFATIEELDRRLRGQRTK